MYVYNYMYIYIYGYWGISVTLLKAQVMVRSLSKSLLWSLLSLTLLRAELMVRSLSRSLLLLQRHLLRLLRESRHVGPIWTKLCLAWTALRKSILTALIVPRWLPKPRNSSRLAIRYKHFICCEVRKQRRLLLKDCKGARLFPRSHIYIYIRIYIYIVSLFSCYYMLL